MKSGSQSGADPQPRRGKTSKTRWERMQKHHFTLAHLLEQIINAKRSEGFSKDTGAWYNAAISDYSAWLEQQGLEATLGNFTLNLVRAYIVNLQERPAILHFQNEPKRPRKLSDHTINSYVRALLAFSNWLYREHYTAEPVLDLLKPTKVTKKVQDILTPEEIAKILTSLNPRTEIGARDQAIILMLLDTGMRAAELCNLTLDDLRLDQGFAMVLGKGKKERPVKIGARAAKAIRFYITHWRQPAMSHIKYVFLTCRGMTREADVLAPLPGEVMTTNALQCVMRRIAEKSGVTRLHAHLLRHTFACMYLVRHRDPFALKSLLGHTTLAMTNHYCEAVQQMDVVKADTVSIIDGLDLRSLDNSRRGRPPTDLGVRN